jgi:hypothetical protein
MELQIPVGMTANTGKSEFRSLEATVHLLQEPLKLLVTGSLYVNYSLENITLVKTEQPNQSIDELFLELTYLKKIPSEKGIYNIFHYAEVIPKRGTYRSIRIICHGIESGLVPVQQVK